LVTQFRHRAFCVIEPAAEFRLDGIHLYIDGSRIAQVDGLPFKCAVNSALCGELLELVAALNTDAVLAIRIEAIGEVACGAADILVRPEFVRDKLAAEPIYKGRVHFQDALGSGAIE